MTYSSSDDLISDELWTKLFFSHSIFNQAFDVSGSDLIDICQILLDSSSITRSSYQITILLLDFLQMFLIGICLAVLRNPSRLWKQRIPASFILCNSAIFASYLLYLDIFKWGWSVVKRLGLL